MAVMVVAAPVFALMLVAMATFWSPSVHATVVEVNGHDLDLSFVPPDPDVGLGMTELVARRGYEIETHYVTTRDGYILSVFRIPHGKASATVGTPIILQHGLLDSSITWVNNYETESLAFVLADSGYDVWMGNNRGNRYSRNHTTLNPDDGEAFWQFSWDEMASEDVPAIIHFVLNQTSSASTSWVGHSEGTIQMFAAASSQTQDPYLASALSSLDLFVALAPVAYVRHMESKLLVALAHSQLVERLYRHGKYEFLPYGPIDKIAGELCQVAENVCDVLLMSICGPTRQINESRIQVYLSNYPAGTSLQNMDHWMQGVLKNSFQRYDYGSAQANQAHYGSDAPPRYRLDAMSVRTALFAGAHDFLADPQDVEQMVSELPADKLVYADYRGNFAHADYVWAPAASREVYPQVLAQLAKYSAPRT